MDLGAQYAYPESVDYLSGLDWPVKFLDKGSTSWKSPMTYDSSGLEIYDEIGRNVSEFFHEIDFEKRNDPNPDTSVGEYIERV